MSLLHTKMIPKRCKGKWVQYPYTDSNLDIINHLKFTSFFPSLQPLRMCSILFSFLFLLTSSVKFFLVIFGWRLYDLHSHIFKGSCWNDVQFLGAVCGLSALFNLTLWDISYTTDPPHTYIFLFHFYMLTTSHFLFHNMLYFHIFICFTANQQP